MQIKISQPDSASHVWTLYLSAFTTTKCKFYINSPKVHIFDVCVGGNHQFLLVIVKDYRINGEHLFIKFFILPPSWMPKSKTVFLTYSPCLLKVKTDVSSFRTMPMWTEDAVGTAQVTEAGESRPIQLQIVTSFFTLLSDQLTQIACLSCQTVQPLWQTCSQCRWCRDPLLHCR